MREGVIAGSAIGAVSSAFAAFAASLCCAGPAVVVVIGSSGAMAAAGFEPYRVHLLVASFALLAVGFWRTCWPSQKTGWCAVRIRPRLRAALWVSLSIMVASTVLPALFG
ncbi:MAG: mercuric transporter MerT family protein [Myxococcaceae bacterium]